MPMASPIPSCPLTRKSDVGGSDITTTDRGDIAQPEEAVVDTKVDVAKAVLGGELHR
jgi:hypothetical protein